VNGAGAAEIVRQIATELGAAAARQESGGPASNQAARDILTALDQGRSIPGARANFPILDEAYVYLVDVRLTAYRDQRVWAIVIERLGFNPRGVGHGGIRLDLFYYGPGPTLEPDRMGFRRTSIHVTEDGPEGPTFDDSGTLVRPDARSIRIRGQVVPIRTDAAFYAERGVDVEVMSEAHAADLLRSYERLLRRYEEDPPKRPVEPDARERRAAALRGQVEKYRGQTRVMGHHLLRALLPEHRGALLATDAERRAGLRDGLAQFLQLNEWEHPDLNNRQLPSETETFPMLAEALAAGDPSLYRPTVPPNTHWRHWPEGGSL
jgi:hypothetical protein